MENKQIIIDGVDVSGCGYYISNGECANKNIYPDYCSACSNCIYKLKQKLERKEQECEELKKFQKLLEKQMKFNKSELELSLSSEIKRSEILLKEFKKVDKQRDTWREKAEKYFKTLTEIKELLLKTPTDSQIHCVNAKSVILQKINKCEGNND